tara:strand:+ start:630 stop:839 length:210 start_codon:yes stop_codon:yes gene_type:complete
MDVYGQHYGTLNSTDKSDYNVIVRTTLAKKYNVKALQHFANFDKLYAPLSQRSAQICRIAKLIMEDYDL